MQAGRLPRVVVSLLVGLGEGFPLIGGSVGGAGCLLPSQHGGTGASGNSSGVLGGGAFGNSAVSMACFHSRVMHPIDQRVYRLTSRAAGMHVTRSLRVVMRKTDTRRIGQALRHRIIGNGLGRAGAVGRSNRIHRRFAVKRLFGFKRGVGPR